MQFYAEKGYQIGSSGNPQKEQWTIKTTIPENVVLTSYSLELSTASKGKGEYSFTLGSYTNTSEFANTDPQLYSETGLNAQGTEIEIGLKSLVNKAMYLKSIKLEFYVPEGVDFKVDEDVVETPEEPDTPEGEYDVIEKIDLTDKSKFPRTSTYVPDNKFTYNSGEITMSNGMVNSSTSGYEGFTVGSNDPDKLVGTVKSNIAQLFDSTASSDTFTITYEDQKVYIASLLFDFTTDASNLFTFDLNVRDSKVLVCGYVIESVDNGATWKIGTKFDVTNSVTYEKENVESTRYGIVFMSSNARFRNTITTVTIGKTK